MRLIWGLAVILQVSTAFGGGEAQLVECQKLLSWYAGEGCALNPKQNFNFINRLYENYCYEQPAIISFGSQCGSLDPKINNNVVSMQCESAVRGCADSKKENCSEMPQLNKATCMRILYKSLAKSQFDGFKAPTDEEIKKQVRAYAQMKPSMPNTTLTGSSMTRSYTVVCYMRSISGGEISKLNYINSSDPDSAVKDAMSSDIYHRCAKPQVGKGVEGGGGGVDAGSNQNGAR